MTQVVKFGIVGLGIMGRDHANAVRQMERARLTAVCDADAGQFAKLPGTDGMETFTDADRFFASADMDAVVIATPHYDHVPLALKALEHGKHVLVEKPISAHVALARQLVDAIPRYPNQQLAVMFNQRTLPAHRKIKQLIDGGELGTIRRVNWIITNWFRTQAYYDSGGWRGTWKGEGGGVLINQCPHQLDLMQWFFGMPCRVTAYAALGKYHDIEVEDDVTALLEYPSGATGVFIASTGEAPGTNRLEITAENGRLVYEQGALRYTRNETPMSEFSRASPQRSARPDVWDVAIPVEADASRQHRDVIENFRDAILNGADLIAPAAEGVRSLELGNAMLYAGLKRTTVELPLDGEAYERELRRLMGNQIHD